ncbi:MAG: ribosome rescue protein RqcH [Methanoregula sp.]|nr:MAG: ribosome rescue protein RqcH [Methanoregula sp.]
MATQAGMSGIDVKAVVMELGGKLPLWIDKVYQFDQRTLGIRLNGEKHAKYLFIIEAGRRAHLASELPDPPKNPPQFAMLLRKHISGGKVLAIRQHGLERVIIIDIGKGNAVYRLITELYDDGNVVLADEAYRIVKPLVHHRFKDRDVISGVPYALSAADPTASEESLATFLRNDDRDLVRALAMGCMLGGAYAEYICRQAGMDKAMPAKDADPKRIYAAIQALFDRVEHDRKPVITAKGCEPVDLTGTTGERQYMDFNAALDRFYPATKSEIIKKTKKKIPKDEMILRHQQSAVKKFDAKIAQAERAVAAIYENYPVVADVIATLSKESKKRSWQEIAALIKKNPTGMAGKIVSVHPEKGAVGIDLGEQVMIFVNETVEQNAGRCYDEIKKFRRKKEGALAAMAKPVIQKKAVKRDIVALKKQWYHRFRWFVTSDNVVVIGGRDAGQNEELVKKYMAGGDTFVHADVHGASVVIVKGKTERMDEAVQFAASYSGAWKSGHFSADVYSALPSQVSKTPEHGEFVSRGSFVVRGERTWYRNVTLGVAIGLQLEPQAAVIGGPPDVIRKHAKSSVELKPGQYEPNDVAKKVLRALKNAIPDEVSRGLMGILNTETVAAFVPPGGSDIAGES